MLLISPTEPQRLRELGTVSSQPEKYGSDMLFMSEQYGMVGIQRKEFKDFVNSVHDGRLGKELQQLKAVNLGCLILEGDPKWTTTGASLVVPSWRLTQHQGVLLSLQSQGYWHLSTPTIEETGRLILQLQSWLKKETHSFLLSRPGPTNPWGRPDNRDWCVHLLQSFEGIGAKLAGQILDHFEGKVPLMWSCSIEDLLRVPGIGAKRAEALYSLFHVRDDA